MLFKRSAEETEENKPLADLKARIEGANLPDTARETALREVAALEKMESS